MEKFDLKIPTIHCEGCLSGIRQALERLPGVQTVEGDVKVKRVIITLQDGQVGRDEICATLAELGHICGET